MLGAVNFVILRTFFKYFESFKKEGFWAKLFSFFLKKQRFLYLLHYINLKSQILLKIGSVIFSKIQLNKKIGKCV